MITAGRSDFKPEHRCKKAVKSRFEAAFMKICEESAKA
jgi:hypothetical protein